MPVLPDQFSALHHAKKSAAAEIVASAKAELSTDQATISLAAASQSAVSKDQAQVAALAAGAPLVTTLTDPVPTNGTVEILQTGAGGQVWQVVTGAWSIVGWITMPTFANVAGMALATGLLDGQNITVTGGENTEREYFTYDATSTAPVDGALVVTATGMGAGRLISTRTVYASWGEMNTDVRTPPAGTALTVRGVGGFTAATSGQDLTLSGGLKVTVDANSSGERIVEQFGLHPNFIGIDCL